MKNLFAYNMKNGSDKTNADIFAKRELSADINDKLSQFLNDAEHCNKKSEPPAFVSILRVLLIGVGLLISVIVLVPQKDLSISDKYHNAPALFYIGPALLLSGLVILLVEYLKKKNMVKSNEYVDLEKKEKNIMQECLNDLIIPLDADKIDVLFFSIKQDKNGNEKKKNIGVAGSLNRELYIFVEQDNLCLGFLDQVIMIPLNSFKRIVKINKTISFFGWNKDVSYKSEEYKQYKIRANQYNCLFVKPYYSVQLEFENETYEFNIPSYELDSVKKYLGIPVEEEEKK